MEQLRKIIREEQIRIEKDYNKKDEKLEFYKDFFADNDCTTIDGLLTVNYSLLAMAILASSDQTEDLDLIINTVIGNSVIFDCLEKEGLEAVLTILNMIDGLQLYDELYEILKKEKLFINKNPFSASGKLIFGLKKLLKNIDISQPAFASFMLLAKTHKDQLIETCSLLASIKQLKKDLIKYKDEIDGVEETLGIKIKDKSRLKAVNKQMQNDWNIDNMTQTLLAIKEKTDKKDKENKAKRKQMLRQQELYCDLEHKLLEELKKPEIKNPEKLINGITNEQIRQHILRIIYDHNKKHYDTIVAEYEELSSNPTYKYQLLLEKYGISADTYDVETLGNNSLEEIEKIIMQLAKINITDKDYVIKVLQDSNLETVNTYVELVIKGIIAEKLLIENISLLNPNSTQYENFHANLDLLQEHRINPYVLNSSQNVFITSHELLDKNIKTMKSYNMHHLIKANIDNSFLSGEDLAEAIDLLLELGYETYLEENIQILNYKDNFNRLKIVKNLNIPVTTTEDLLDLLTTEKFFIPDDLIEDYTYNATQHNIPNDIILSSSEKEKDITEYLENLHKFTSSSRTYDFDGVTISKNKVARNLLKTSSQTPDYENLLFSVISGSTLSDEEIIKIKESISQKQKNKSI